MIEKYGVIIFLVQNAVYKFGKNTSFWEMGAAGV